MKALVTLLVDVNPELPSHARPAELAARFGSSCTIVNISEDLGPSYPHIPLVSVAGSTVFALDNDLRENAFSALVQAKPSLFSEKDTESLASRFAYSWNVLRNHSLGDLRRMSTLGVQL